MNNLIVRDRVISIDPTIILDCIQRECKNGKLQQYKLSGSGIAVTCPHHSGGMERHPSMYLNISSDGVPYLYAHCFTCGQHYGFIKFVAECFDKSKQWAEDWLIENFADGYVENIIELEDINLNKKQDNTYMDEAILDKFESYHPYMDKRRLSRDVCEKYEVKYDPETRCLVFPVRDSKGKLKFLTRRSVEGRMFIIDSKADKKDVYLLYDAIRNRAKTIFITESQTNALTLLGWGYQAVGLFGAGTTQEQVNELNKTDATRFILCYDPDEAGEKGAKRFKKFIRKDAFVDELHLPPGRDVNDLTKEEFENLLKEQLGEN